MNATSEMPIRDGGAAGRALRERDWTSSPLGAPEGWPDPLRTMLRLVLSTERPALLVWGSERLLFPNDAYNAAFGGGTEIPGGTPGPGSAIWPRIGPLVDQVLRSGAEAWTEANGRAEGWECSYIPVTGDAGGAQGVLTLCTGSDQGAFARRRQQFQMAFDEAMRGADTSNEVIETATRMLGQHLKAGRCGYAEFDAKLEWATVAHDWTDGTMPSAAGRWRVSDFGADVIAPLEEGRSLRIHDVLNDPDFDEEAAANHIAVGGMRANLTVPYLREGRLAAGLYLHTTSPRAWTDADEELLRHVAERVWHALDRARNEAELREGRAVLDFTLRSAQVGDWDLDLVTDTARRSLRHDQCFGYDEPLPEWGFETFIRHVHPQDRDRVERAFREAVEQLTDWHFECRVVWPDNSVHWIEAHGSIYRAEDERPTRMLGIVADITARKRAEALQAAQKRILEQAVLEASLETTLDGLIRAIETESQGGVLGSVMLVDRDRQHLSSTAGPSLPDEYLRAVNGVPVRDGAGSCGTAAMRNRPVYVSDVATDPLWTDYRELALSHGLRACWSIPIVSSRGQVLGTFAMYYPEPREPNPVDLELVEICIRTAALVIERKAVEQALQESEARFQFALDAASAVGTWDWEVKSDTIYADRRFAELFSVDPDQARAGTPIGNFLAAIHPEDVDQVGKEIERALAGAAPYRAEYRVVQADGTTRWVLARGHAYHDASGTPERFPGVVLDITDRKRSETYRQALIELTDAWRDCSDPGDIAYAAAEILGRTLDASRAGYGTIDPEAETVTIERDWRVPGMDSLAGVLNFRDYGDFIEDLKRGEMVVFADGETDPRTCDYADALSEVSVRALVNMPVMEQGRLVAVFYLNHREVRHWSDDELRFIREVSDRTRTAVERARTLQDLHESEARFRGVTEAMPGFVWTADAEGNVDYTSTSWFEYSGGDESVYGRGWADYVHPEDRDRVLGIWTRAFTSGERYEAEFRLRRHDGVYRWWLIRAVPVQGGQNRPVRWIGSAADIDQIVQAREILARSRDELERAVGARTAERDRLWTLSRDPFLIADMTGRWLSVSPGWTGILGWTESELIGQTSQWLLHPDDQAGTAALVADLAAGRGTERFENRLRTRDGGYRWIAWTAVPDDGLIFAVARDVTAEKDAAEALRLAEEQLRQSQKMEAVGQLTGGIAHDFNNMLAVVISSLNLLERRVGVDERGRRFVDAAADAARRAATLTQRLLAFSRRQPLRPEAVDANKVVSGMAELLTHSLGGDIELETVLAGGLWRTHADPHQLENVLLNLAVNARDAMAGGGRLTIETQNAHLDDRYVAREIGLPAGQYVMIAVTDTGAGMSEEVLAHAFEPFFTTKDVGKGTGLGLSQVYGFVRQSGGHVRIYSEPGQGTTVKVYLPRLYGTVTGDDGAAAGVKTETLAGEAHEVILLVEDEPAVRQTSKDALIELGYSVLEADGGEAALRLIRDHPQIDLMFTDVVMPGMNGAELARRAQAARPDLKVLFTTGYTRNAVVHNGVLDPGVQLIGKPYTLEELAAKLREILDT